MSAHALMSSVAPVEPAVPQAQVEPATPGASARGQSQELAGGGLKGGALTGGEQAGGGLAGGGLAGGGLAGGGLAAGSGAGGAAAADPFGAGAGPPAAGPGVGGELAAFAAGGGGQAPDPRVRRQVEAVTGADLSAARVHTGAGSAAAAAGVQARAFATGDAVHFGAGQYAPGSADGDFLLAHELAHTAQQHGGAGRAQLKSAQRSEPGDAAERQADQIAHAAVGGASARIAPTERAAPVARTPEHLSGNPAERTDASGTATTTHRAPTLGDAVNAPAAAAAAGQAEQVMNVRVVADATTPVHSAPPATPAAAALYTEGDAAASPAPPGFSTVVGFNGTLAQPRATQEATNDLFINGTPTADDVQQSGIGDCFFLAAAMSVVSRDPGRIQQMVQPDGAGGARITLWRAQAHTPTIWERITGRAPARDWTQVEVSVTNELAVRVSNNRVMGAQLRCAPAPASANHWAAVEGDRLAIHSTEQFQCARWAPLLEKAYARFSQSHDQYGGARPGGKGGASGYDNINGGWSHKALCVFYGPESDAPGANLGQDATTWAPGGDVVMSNRATMDRLALLQGRGPAAAPGETAAPIVTATAMVDPLFDRLALALPAAQADADWAAVDVDHQTHASNVLSAVTAWQALPADAALPAPQPKKAARDQAAAACVTAMAPGVNDSAVQQRTLDRFRNFTGRPILFPTSETAVPADRTAGLNLFNHNLEFFKSPAVEVRVEGHASRTGDSATNQQLSEDRARAVEALVSGPRVITPHTTAVSALGDSGATAAPDWQRVDLDVSVTGKLENPLLANGRSPAIRAAVDLMLNLRNAGTDASTGQRNIYGNHVYSVVAVTLLTASGDTAQLRDVPPELRAAVYPTVDPERSTVVLRNPHHGNEPDRTHSETPTRPGDGAPSGAAADGTFTMTLSEFFRNFTSVESGVFSRT